MKTIKKVLIANRGEIALRIIKSCKEMGIATVAIHSEADSEAPFVYAADEAVCVGPAPSAESYLVIENVINAAKSTGADAIHPGYGFLSENALFAEAVTEAGIIFIGPSPESIRVMGDKLSAKEAVQARDIPLVPGTEGAISDPEEALKEAARIGMPLIIKASAGGGGKGMRAVHDEALVKDELARAISEAERSFGNGAVFMERLVLKPRHIEVQVLADTHGNVLHIFERECSIQRRHQKVVEEAPSALLDAELRDKMGKCAVEVAKSCDYVGAGTVEFLVDEDRNFYFLEMNTRLQVEHPVTECISGIDLVKEQIRIAEGKEITFKQKDLEINGHAIELRVYAEDTGAGFLPCTGNLKRYSPPTGHGVRVDDGIQEGDDVSIHYDPMLSKLIVHADTREECIEAMLRAIDNYEVIGVKTTLDFGWFAINHEAFRSGNFDTGFVGQYFTPEKLVREIPVKDEVFAEIAKGLSARIQEDRRNENKLRPEYKSAWRLRRQSFE